MALYLDASLRRTAIPDVATPRTYIRSREFDATLLLAPIFAGLAAALVVTADPRLYPFLLIADLWLLGYHHVVATYTRLAFDTQSLRRNRVLAVDLLVGVTLVTLGVAMTAGAWVIASAYLYLQWFHYMRQGHVISRMYYRATSPGQDGTSRDLIADVVIYVVPIYAIAHRSGTLEDLFLSMPVKTIAPPELLVTMLGIAALLAVALWIGRTVHRAMSGTADARYDGFILSHVVVFLTAYVWIGNANVGWLVIDVWHNLQYVLVMWMVNVKLFGGEVDPAEPLLSRISQHGRAIAYFTCCVVIATLLYAGLNRFTAFFLGGGLAATLGVYMAVNFHHHVVDALIWRKPHAK